MVNLGWCAYCGQESVGLWGSVTEFLADHWSFCPKWGSWVVMPTIPTLLAIPDSGHL